MTDSTQQQATPHKITVEELGDEGYNRLMRLISDISARNGRAVVYVYPEMKDEL